MVQMPPTRRAASNDYVRYRGNRRET